MMKKREDLAQIQKAMLRVAEVANIAHKMKSEYCKKYAKYKKGDVVCYKTSYSEGLAAVVFLRLDDTNGGIVYNCRPLRKNGAEYGRTRYNLTIKEKEISQTKQTRNNENKTRMV